MEQRLFDAGWTKIDANRYEHPEKGELIRDSGFWYVKPPNGLRRKVGFKLSDAIRRVLNG
jgi:hypothetical protein